MFPGRQVYPVRLSGARNKLNRLLLFDGNTVADYLPGNYTGTLNASAWLNSIGAAPSLAQASGAAQPAIQADGSLLFDGIAMFMQAAFTLNQPETIYLVAKQVTWAGIYMDGAVSNATMRLQSNGSTPKVATYAGAFTPDNANWAVGVNGVVTAIFNGISSSLQIDSTTKTTGDSGSANGGGITIGSLQLGTSGFGNIQFKEIIVRNVADSAATQAQIQSLLRAIHGTP